MQLVAPGAGAGAPGAGAGAGTGAAPHLRADAAAAVRRPQSADSYGAIIVS